MTDTKRDVTAPPLVAATDDKTVAATDDKTAAAMTASTPDPAQNPKAWAAQLLAMRDIGLVLDDHGQFHHRGVLVTHARLHHALLTWLDIDDTGRDVIRLDAARFAYVQIDDTHLRARSAHWRDDRCFVLWDDDSEDELDYSSLKLRSDNAIEVSVRGKLRGRIGSPAYYQVAEHIVEVGDWFAFEAAGRRWPIAGFDQAN